MSTDFIAGDASVEGGILGGNDGAMTLRVGPAGSKINGLAISAAGVVTAQGNVVAPGFQGRLTAGGSLTLGTAVNSTSGTSIDFTGIPSWARRITVMFAGVSTSGTSNYLLQIGAGSLDVSGYISTSGILVTTSYASGSSTAGFLLTGSGPEAAALHSGVSVITLLGGNTYTHFGNLGAILNSRSFSNSGSKTLGGTLDRIRITTANGTDTFDAGSVNILYEG